jgi:hypothetical protein
MNGASHFSFASTISISDFFAKYSQIQVPVEVFLLILARATYDILLSQFTINQEHPTSQYALT